MDTPCPALLLLEVIFVFPFPAFRVGTETLNGGCTRDMHVHTSMVGCTQDHLSDRFGSETHDDGGGQGATIVQEQLPLLQDHGGEGGLPGFLQGIVGEPHQGDGDVDIAGDVRRGSSSPGKALRPLVVGVLNRRLTCGMICGFRTEAEVWVLLVVRGR